MDDNIFSVLFKRLYAVEYEKRDPLLEHIINYPSYKGAFGASLLDILYINQMRPVHDRFKICRETVLTIPVVIYTRKDFYLTEALDQKIEILVAAGLVEFWQFQDVDKQFLNYEQTNDSQPLTIRQMKGSFQILLLGSIASIVLFLYELFKMKLDKTPMVHLVSRRFMLWKRSLF